MSRYGVNSALIFGVKIKLDNKLIIIYCFIRRYRMFIGPRGPITRTERWIMTTTILTAVVVGGIFMVQSLIISVPFGMLMLAPFWGPIIFPDKQ